MVLNAHGTFNIAPTHFSDDMFAPFVYLVPFFHQNEKVFQLLKVPDFRILKKQVTKIFSE